MTKTRTIFFLLLAAVAAALPAAASAGDVWLDTDRGNEVRLELVKPSFDNIDLTFGSTIWYVSLRNSVGDQLYLDVDLPYAHFAFDRSGYYYVDESSSTIGNPYIGLEFGPDDNGFVADVGGRLPLASDSEWAGYRASVADPVDNMETFLPDVTSLTLGLGYRYRGPTGLGVRFRVAPTVWFNADELFGDDNELYVLYSVQVEQRQGSASFGAGLSGRYLASEDIDSFGQRTLHEADLYCNLWFPTWRPTIRLRVPLDEDLTEVLNPSLVLGVGFGLP